MVGLLAVLMLGSADPASAYPQMIFEQEPNDTLDTAQSFRGAARLVGEVSEGDVDKYLWAVDDAEADQLWRIELQMQGEAPVSATLSLPPVAPEEEQAGGVAVFGEAADSEPESEASQEPTAVLTLEAPPQRPLQRLEPLLVSHGDYLITLSGASGAYQLTLEPVGEAELHGQVAAGAELDALMVAPGRNWLFQIDTERWSLPLELDEADDWLWRLQTRGELDTELTVRLVDTEGEALADEVSGIPLVQRWDSQALPEGSRIEFRHPQGEPIGRVMLRLEQAGPMPDPEPEVVAGSLAEAHPLAPDDAFEAELLPDERMYFRFSLPLERLDGQAWTIRAKGWAARHWSSAWATWSLSRNPAGKGPGAWLSNACSRRPETITWQWPWPIAVPNPIHCELPCSPTRRRPMARWWSLWIVATGPCPWGTAFLWPALSPVSDGAIFGYRCRIPVTPGASRPSVTVSTSSGSTEPTRAGATTWLVV
ncbi:hypothetical protein Q427_24460 [Halomonas sp. BC04]|nr:hypothetical protein Q427_24460 [Halomonas sp. BC04]